MNLTGHRDAASLMRHLILESLALGRCLEVELRGPPARVADLGSGAGFPGLPLALLWPGSRVALIESRERRHVFQRAALRALRIGNVEPRLGRAERLPARPHELVVAQALGPPQDTLARMARWAAPRGWIALPCSSLLGSLRPPEGFEFAGHAEYRSPGGGRRRYVWLGRDLSSGRSPRNRVR